MVDTVYPFALDPDFSCFPAILVSHRSTIRVPGLTVRPPTRAAYTLFSNRYGRPEYGNSKYMAIDG